MWRDFEIFLTRMLAEYEGRRFYLRARRDPASALADLARPRPAPSLYLSYPITAIQTEAPALLDEARTLATRLRNEGFVVFDPLAIKDVPTTRAAAGITSEIPQAMERAAKQAGRYSDRQKGERDGFRCRDCCSAAEGRA